jgi:hypothetical protein
MLSRFNAWTLCGVVFCALVWAGLGVTGAKMANIYENLGPQGFRHELVARLDHKVGRLKAMVVSAEPLV